MNKIEIKPSKGVEKLNKVQLDELDSRILNELRANCKQTWRELAKKLGVSPVTIMNRTKALEGRGVITGYSATLDFMKIGFDFSAYQTLQIDGKNFYKVLDSLTKMPETEAVYAVSGDFDCILFFRTTDQTNFSRIVQKIRTLEGVKSSKTFFAYEVWKTGGRQLHTAGVTGP